MTPSGKRIPGEYFLQDGAIELNAGREAVRLRVENPGDRPIQVGSHTHFYEVNDALRFDRPAAYGRRLDVPAGTSVEAVGATLRRLLRFVPGRLGDDPWRRKW